MEVSPQPSFFYRVGRGVFFALGLLVLPVWLVWAFYERLESLREGLADLPVFEKMHGDFQTGLALAGGQFYRETEKFYDLDTLAPDPEIALDHLQPAEQQRLVRPGKIYWQPDDLQKRLLDELPAHKHPGVKAYLAYLREFKGLALSEMRRSKIPASVTLAQGLLESDAGRSFLATRAYNHFGVKCRQTGRSRSGNALIDNDFGHHSLANDCIQRHDDNPWDRFEAYPAPDASFRRHSLLLLGERYSWMIRQFPVGKICPLPKPFEGENEAPYYIGWSQGLKTSGYATSKRYAEKLALIIETYQLWKIDYEALIA